MHVSGHVVKAPLCTPCVPLSPTLCMQACMYRLMWHGCSGVMAMLHHYRCTAYEHSSTIKPVHVWHSRCCTALPYMPLEPICLEPQHAVGPVTLYCFTMADALTCTQLPALLCCDPRDGSLTNCMTQLWAAANIHCKALGCSQLGIIITTITSTSSIPTPSWLSSLPSPTSCQTC